MADKHPLFTSWRIAEDELLATHLAYVRATAAGFGVNEFEVERLHTELLVRRQAAHGAFRLAMEEMAELARSLRG